MVETVLWGQEYQNSSSFSFGAMDFRRDPRQFREKTIQTFHEIRNCEGYYFDTLTRSIVRIVGPGPARCWREGSTEETELEGNPDGPRFVLLSTDVLAPLATIRRDAKARYGAVGGVVNRQTAIEESGDVVTEEARAAP